MILRVEIHPYHAAYRLPLHLLWRECDYLNDIQRLKRELIEEHNSKLTERDLKRHPNALCTDVEFYMDTVYPIHF